LRVEDGKIHSETDLYPPHGLPGYFGLPEDFLRNDLPRYDLLKLKCSEQQGLYDVYKTEIDGAMCIMKISPRNWLLRFIYNEICIYHVLMDREISFVPKFKGYVYEEDPSRVIGILYEYIEGRHPKDEDFRYAKRL